MQGGEFLKYSGKVSEYVVDYLKNIHSRPVIPNIAPGFMRHLIPSDAPTDPESMDQILEDVERKIMPGVTHWQHPGFFAYFPAGNSYPSILADMISDAIGCVGFSWAASPSCTELETIMMDWLAKMIGLPEHFLFHQPESAGGGVIQGSASECILVSMLTARNRALEDLKQLYPDVCPGILLYKLVAYCSNQAHCSVVKAAQICFINLKSLETDYKFSLRGPALRRVVEEDEDEGLFPFMVIGSLGTTSCCSFDNLEEIGEICATKNLWFHIDAAYAGSAFICPELRVHLKGIQYADSFNMNPNKWMLINFDCSAYWVKDRTILINTMNQNPVYLQHKNSSSEYAIDYRHWGIPLSRRFRSLKLWFVIRSYGVKGIQNYIRNHIKLAKVFEKMVREDDRFEIYGEVNLGLVCFRLKGTNEVNKILLDELNNSGKIHMIPSMLKGTFIIRFAVCRENATLSEIKGAWCLISHTATRLRKRLAYAQKKLEIVLEKNLWTIPPNPESFSHVKEWVNGLVLNDSTLIPTYYEGYYMCAILMESLVRLLPSINHAQPSNGSYRPIYLSSRTQLFLKTMAPVKIIFLQWLSNVRTCDITRPSSKPESPWEEEREDSGSQLTKSTKSRKEYMPDFYKVLGVLYKMLPIGPKTSAKKHVKFGDKSFDNFNVKREEGYGIGDGRRDHKNDGVGSTESCDGDMVGHVIKAKKRRYRKRHSLVTEYLKLYDPCVGDVGIQPQRYDYITTMGKTNRAMSLY